MKRILSLLLALNLVFVLVACSNEKGTSSNTNITQSNVDKMDDESQEDTSTINSEKSNTDEISNDSKTQNSSKPTSSKTSKPSTSNKGNTKSSKPSSNTNVSSTSKTTTNNNSSSTHVHSYSAATCTEPKKCSCGVTTGNSLGHKYSGYSCEVCNSLNPNKEYIKLSEKTLGIDGKGVYGRAGEDYGFMIKDECKNYVASIDNITATINGEKCPIHLALNKKEVEKLANNYVHSMKEYYIGKGWGFDKDDEETFKGIAQEYYMPCSAIAGVDFPIGIFEQQKENITDFDKLPCKFIITVQYTLIDGTQAQQYWERDAIYTYYSMGTIPAKCFSHAR